ncbi:unnamed protein product [Ectocarpus sp. 8 AP-2014]
MGFITQPGIWWKNNTIAMQSLWGVLCATKTFSASVVGYHGRWLAAVGDACVKAPYLVLAFSPHGRVKNWGGYTSCWYHLCVHVAWQGGGVEITEGGSSAQCTAHTMFHIMGFLSVRI